MTIIDLVKNTFKEAQKNQSIVVESASFEPTSFDTEKLSQFFAKNTGIVLQPNLKELLNLPGQMQLSWRSSSVDKLIPSGSFQIENIENALLQKKNIVPIHNQDIPNETSEILKHCHYFDTFPNFTWDIATVLYYDKKNDLIKLFFLDRLELHPLDLDLKQYIEMCMLTKGMYYWQYLFCNTGKMAAYKRPYIDLILPFLTKTFPDHDYSPLEDRYKIWKDSISI